MNKNGPFCNVCPLKNEAGIVWGEGPPDAKLIIIGMAPATEEINAVKEDGEVGRPFMGPSGSTLNFGLKKAGITREKTYITNLVKCFVKPRTQVPAGAIKCCRPLLDRELDSLHQSNTILTLGGPPFDHLTGKHFSTVTNKKNQRAWLRGAPIEIGRRTIIGAAHPAYLQTIGFRDQPWWQSDINKAVRISREGVTPLNEQFNYNPTEEEVDVFIDEIISAGEFGLDIETSEKVLEEEGDLIGRGKADIQVIGLALRSGKVIGVPPHLFTRVQRLFGYRTKRLTCYVFNAGFDIYHLRREFDFSDEIRVFDCMLALNLLFSDIRPKDLGMFMSIFTDLPYTKNLAKVDPQRYNAYDTLGVAIGGPNAAVALEEMKLTELFWNHEMALWPVVDELRTVGTNCDVKNAVKLEIICNKALSQYEQFWHKISPVINWTQNKELLVMFQKQGLPLRYAVRTNPKTKAKTRTPTIDMDVLEEYRDRYHSQTAGLILLMRQLKKASDFTHIYDSDGRAHVQYDIKGQKMGRIQAKDPDLQNIPEELTLSGGYTIRPRTIVIPDNPDEDLIISADFEQIEFWIYAHAAHDEPLLTAKRRGEYIYGLFFEDLLHKPFFQDNMPRKKAFKRKDVGVQDLLLAKSGPLGLIYGRGENSLIQGFGMSKTDAMKFKNNFFNAHLAISAYHTRLLQEAAQYGYLRNFFGRIRRFPFVQTMRNEILSFPGQSNAAEILRRNALFPLFKGLRDFNARLILTVHDSVAVSCPKKTAHGAVSFIRECMEAPVSQMEGFWPPAEVSIGCKEKSTTGNPNWGDVISYEDYCILERASRADNIETKRATGEVQSSAGD